MGLRFVPAQMSEVQDWGVENFRLGGAGVAFTLLGCVTGTWTRRFDLLQVHDYG